MESSIQTFVYETSIKLNKLDAMRLEVDASNHKREEIQKSLTMFQQFGIPGDLTFLTNAIELEKEKVSERISSIHVIEEEIKKIRKMIDFPIFTLSNLVDRIDGKNDKGLEFEPIGESIDFANIEDTTEMYLDQRTFRKPLINPWKKLLSEEEKESFLIRKEKDNQFLTRAAAVEENKSLRSHLMSGGGC